MSASQLQPGDRVWHWFAGTGTVRRPLKQRGVMIDWDKGGSGVARANDCRLQPQKGNRRGHPSGEPGC
jgi:hypothetical protein